MTAVTDAAQLTGVSRTALVTLAARAAESGRSDALFSDEKAVEIANRLSVSFRRSRRDWISQVGIAVRTRILDDAASRFLAAHPKALVVNLGAGLCTRFFRIDNGEVEWIDVDVPAVEPLWQRVIGSSNRHRFLAASVLEPAWLERLELAPDRPTLFIAEGLLMYFEERQVRTLLARLGRERPGAELLAETLGPLLVRNSWLHPAIARTSVRFKWGVRSFADVERWEVGAKFLEEWRCLDHYPDRWRWLRVAGRIPFVRDELKIGRLLLGVPGAEANGDARA